MNDYGFKSVFGKAALYNFHPLQLEKNDYFSGKNIWIPVIL